MAENKATLENGENCEVLSAEMITEVIKLVQDSYKLAPSDADLAEFSGQLHKFKGKYLEEGSPILDRFQKTISNFGARLVRDENIDNLGKEYFDKLSAISPDKKPTIAELISAIKQSLINNSGVEVIDGGVTLENKINLKHNETTLLLTRAIESLFETGPTTDRANIRSKYGFAEVADLVKAMDRINLEGGRPVGENTRAKRKQAVWDLNLELLKPIDYDVDTVFVKGLKSLVNQGNASSNGKGQNISLARLDNNYIQLRSRYRLDKKWSINSRNENSKRLINESENIDWEATIGTYARVNNLDPEGIDQNTIIDLVIDSLEKGNADKITDDVTPYLMPKKGKEGELYQQFGDVSVLTNTLNRRRTRVEIDLNNELFGGDLEAFVSATIKAGNYTRAELSTKQVDNLLHSSVYGLDGAIATFTGKLNTPKNSLVARSFANTRTFISGGVQGTYVVSALYGDPATTFLNYRTFGDTIPRALMRTLWNKKLPTIPNFIRSYKKVGGEDYTRTSKALNIVIGKQVQGFTTIRYSNASKSQRTLGYESTLNEWTGLMFLTEVRQVQAANGVNNIIRSHIKTPFDKLPIKFKDKLKHYGITESDWKQVKDLPTDNITPDIIGSGFIIDAKQKVAYEKIKLLISGENANAVLVVSRQTEQLAKLGTVLGTSSGEALALIMQLKLHPITMVIKMNRDIFSNRNVRVSESAESLSRYIKGLNPQNAEKFVRSLELFTVLAVAGYLRLYSGELEKLVTGEPMDFSDPVTKATFLRAVIYGGFGTVAPDIYNLIATRSLDSAAVGLSIGLGGGIRISNQLLKVLNGDGDPIALTKAVGRLVPADIYILSAVVTMVTNLILEEAFPNDYDRYMRKKVSRLNRRRREANK